MSWDGNGIAADLTHSARSGHLPSDAQGRSKVGGPLWLLMRPEAPRRPARCPPVPSRAAVPSETTQQPGGHVFFDDRAGVVRVLVVGTCAHCQLLLVLLVALKLGVARLSVRSRTAEAGVKSGPTLVHRSDLLPAVMTGRGA